MPLRRTLRRIATLAAALALGLAASSGSAVADAGSRYHLPDLRPDRPASVIPTQRSPWGGIWVPSVTVRNGGPAAARAFSVTAFIHARTPAGEEVRRTFTARVEGLAAGAVQSVSFLDRWTRFTVPRNARGYVVYTVDPASGAEFRDPYGRVVEVSETNNAVRVDFTTPR